ncbi:MULTISPECIES: helicase associated domain-containing protein [unclassified Streptomyces]|uniref:helicase associated domain-containing protein n=1 Tax=unclassified Streptomyces TaxID=2593676 RepID=UPI0036C2A09D
MTNAKGTSGFPETHRTDHHRQRQPGPRRTGPQLGSWTSNQRGRATTLYPERKKQLSEIGMRWT